MNTATNYIRKCRKRKTMIKPTGTWAELIGTFVAIVIFALLALSFQAWLLGLVFSWFNVILSFWQCVGIIVLLNGILSAAKS